jgi:hypothetical protein
LLYVFFNVSAAIAIEEEASKNVMFEFQKRRRKKNRLTQL